MSTSDDLKKLRINNKLLAEDIFDARRLLRVLKTIKRDTSRSSSSSAPIEYNIEGLREENAQMQRKLDSIMRKAGVSSEGRDTTIKRALAEARVQHEDILAGPPTSSDAQTPSQMLQSKGSWADSA